MKTTKDNWIEYVNVINYLYIYEWLKKEYGWLPEIQNYQ